MIKRGPTHGARHEKAEVQREYHLAWNAWKRCCKKSRLSGGTFYRSSRIQFFMNHNSQSDRQNKSAKSGMDLQKKTIQIISLQRKRKDTKDNGFFTLNKAGKNWPMKLRSDFRAAVSMKNRLHHESENKLKERLHPNQQRRWHSSSSASWWDKSGWNWK